jgi:AraC-like DNA-binding protein
VLQQQHDAQITVARGQMLFVAGGAGMLPVYASRYRSLGVLYQPGFIRLLLVNNVPQSPLHRHQRYTAVTHLPVGPDTAMRHVLEALRTTDDDLTRCSLGRTLLVMTKVLVQRVGSSTQSASSGKALVSFQAACAYLQEHLAEPISRSDVGRFLKLHPNHISRLFQQFADRPFAQYLLQLRLDEARRLLRRAELNIAQVADTCGFASANYFIRCYRKAYGHPPGQQADRGAQSSSIAQ